MNAVRTPLVLLFSSLLVYAASARAELVISDVSAAPPAFDPASGARTRIRFRISEPARVQLHVYDARNLEVRSIAAEELLPPGEHELAWDGKDARGRIVPAEAYVYTLEASSERGRSTLWDLTDLSGGDQLEVLDTRWEPGSREIHYILPAAARLRIRAGLKNGGPLLATPLDWVPRAAGTRVATWDGKDASGVLDLSEHPELQLRVEAFSLPQNSLLVGPPPAAREWIPDLPATARRQVVSQGRPRRMYDYPRLAADELGDFAVSLDLPSHLERDERGEPVVAGAVPVVVRVPEEIRSSLLDQRFEAVFYIDGRLAFEDETGFLPVTWRFQPEQLAPGVHYLTVNLRGYEGRFGMATRTIRIPAGAH